MTNLPIQIRQQLIQEVLESMNTMKRGMVGHLQAANRSLPIPRPQLELLVAIKQLQPVSFKDLARRLYLSPGAVSQAADGLEGSQLIEREIDPADRRVQCLKVTKKGDKLLEAASKKRQDTMKSIMESLSDEELEVWARVHKKILEHFQNELRKETDKE